MVKRDLEIGDIVMLIIPRVGMQQDRLGRIRGFSSWRSLHITWDDGEVDSYGYDESRFMRMDANPW